MNDKTSSQRAQTFYDDFLTCTDLEAFCEKYFSDETLWENYLPVNVPFGGSYTGEKAICDYFISMMQSIKINSFNIERMIEQGNKVVITGSEGSDVLSTGLSYTMDWVHILEFKDEKLHKVREYNDTAAMTVAFPLEARQAVNA